MVLITQINRIVEAKLLDIIEKLDNNLLNDETKLEIMLLEDNIDHREISRYILLGWYIDSILKNDI